MSYQATVFNVMIASPSDVPDERDMVRDAVLAWNAAHARNRGVILDAVRWETHSHPTMEEPAQAALNKQILRDADLVVGIFGNRIGTPTKDAVSGTVEEVERHLKAGRPAMVYFSDMAMPRERFDPEQWQRLNDYRAECMARGLTQTYASHLEFKDKFREHLAMIMNRWPQALAQRPKDDQDPLSWLTIELPDIKQTLRERQRDELSAEARELLLNAALDSSGKILRSETKDGVEIVTNGKNFVPEGNARASARWTAALNELWPKGLLHVVRFDELFKISDEGYQMADLIRTTLISR
jgi:hypothetical protein